MTQTWTESYPTANKVGRRSDRCESALTTVIILQTGAAQHLMYALAVIEISEAHHLASILVPNLEIYTGQTLPKREPVDSLELAVFVKTFLETVIRDPTIEMMNVVKPNICSQPLQHPGKMVVGTSRNPRRSEVPTLVGLPVRRFKIVLHVE